MFLFFFLGMVCPAETPEGHAVGLVKNLSLMSYISVGSSVSPILEFLEEFGTENLDEISPRSIKEWVLLLLRVVSSHL